MITIENGILNINGKEIKINKKKNYSYAYRVTKQGLNTKYDNEKLLEELRKMENDSCYKSMIKALEEAI